MMVSRSTYRWLLIGSCAGGAIMANSAYAQVSVPTEASPPVEDTETTSAGPAQQTGDIIVTGSRIARPDYVANSPIVSLGQQALENSGKVTIEKALSELPQFTGSFGASNGGSTSTGVNGGQSYASLRGLGPKRTLILLDGRRLQPSNPDGSVDLNIIPEALIGNVEVITGGASTTYGSDATAGVVNFRLRRDFSGLELTSTYGTSDYGDGDQFRVSGTLGGNFADGRGNAVLSVDYTDRSRAYQYNRPYYLARQTTGGTSTLPQGNVLFGSNTPSIVAVNSIFRDKYGTAGFAGTGRYTNQIGFNLDGTLFSNLGVPVLNFRDPQTDLAYIVNTGPASNPASSQQVNFGYTGGSIQSSLERYNIFGKVEYELTDNIRSFIQVTFTDYNSLGIANPTLASNVYALAAPVTNPFLPQDFRTILASRSNPNDDFILYKAFNLAGPRYQGYSYNVYQVTGGLSGKVGVKDWTWDVYGSFSKAKFENEQTGGVSASAVRQLLYSPTGGTEYCAGGLNLFGDFTPSQDCIDYISRRTLNVNELKQRTVEANIQGSLFDWWAGDVRFALGADYRYNNYSFEADSAFNQPDGTSDVLGYSVLLPAAGSVSTKEIYGELLVPVLRDLPLVKEFNLELGYRYSDYSSVGGVSAYKVNVDWQVAGPLRLRGGYNRSIRAPSVGELYAPISTASVGIGTPNATNTNGDPCDRRSSFRIGPNGSQVRALCLAQGIPESLVDSYQLGTGQVFALNGGNPDLFEETADTFSAGAVVTSPFESALFSRMSMSIDFYKIKVKDSVGPLSIADGIRNCFNAGGNNPTYDPSNYYCTLIGRRNPSTGVPVNPTQPLLNLGMFNVQGIDFQFDWQFSLTDLGLGEVGKLSFNTAVSYLDKFEIQALPGAPVYDYAGTTGASIEANAGVAHPRWKAITSLNYSIGPANIGIRWRFIDSMTASARVVTPTSVTRGVNTYNVFDLNGRYTLPWDGELRFGITNLFDRHPPQVGDNEGNFDAQNYDVMGRYFFFGVTQRF